MGDWLPVPALARLVELPETTTRRYVQALEDLLPQRRSGRLTLYDSEVASLVLPRAAELFGAGHRLPEVRRTLKKEFPRVDDAMTPPSTASPPAKLDALTSSFMEALNVLRLDLATMGSALERVQGELRDERSARVVLVQENADMKEKMVTLEAELVRLRKDRRELETFLLGKLKAITSK